MPLTPQEVFRRMYDNDPFSQWMGMELVSIGLGQCTLRMTVRPEMTNGFGVAHGGIAFSLADSAFAFACNTHGRQALSIHCSIEHVAPVRSGDELIAIAAEDHVSNHLSYYTVRVQRTDGTPIAFFRGVAFRKQREWE
ncbi:MAG: hotdog fold thioesterase [Saprospiraceae bacterium]|nr:hotdog fold thioesterase [Saprospiraceae bacterium]MDW8484215.1 hotdog fold thioesterase [Saprospiraceae bacterium]